MTAYSPADARPGLPAAGLFRFLVSAALAMIITACLFLLMRALIHDDAPPEPAAAPAPDIVISFDIPEHEPVPNPLTPEIDFTPPPPRPVIDRTAQAAPGEETMTLSAPVIEYTVEPIVTPQISLLIPQLTGRVDPVYPQRELSRGIEGTCVVRYDILASGRTANAQVLACDSDGFARASLAAVARWTHASQLGRPGDEVVRRGVETRLDFQLE